MKQSFTDLSAAIDGAAVSFFSRASTNGHSQYDANLCTFQRVRNFRRRAMDLRPTFRQLPAREPLFAANALIRALRA